ncbi:MAG: 23S rRNA (uracil(1939)-C(5))-methyltransferase RlmD [Deltaproteobacteria bacterium]|nr:MAG: 23S rRNA (uracil(1939)-C(5))-methyltransferase RlmD [Deltaproteobacteria bacterium]
MTEAALLLDVERLTFGFDALAHHGRQVVFVPYAAPGERVRAEVVERRAGYLRARVAAVLAPGPDRVLPGCRYFPTCGGCQWQHVAPPAQRDAKAAIVAEQLARVAGVRDAEVLPTLASPADWHYRARVTLAVEGRRAGYRRARSHALVEIADCPLADPSVSAHLEAARAWVAALRVPLRRVTVSAAPAGVALAASATARPGPADLAASEALLARAAGVRGTVVTGAGVRLVAGDPTVRVALEPGLDLEVPADVFTQVNPGANQRLVETVLALGAFTPGERVLDLYCGAGNLSLPLARRGVSVLGIERSGVAVEAARANAARHGLPAATFRADDVARALASLPSGSLDAVVLDPPRAGAADALPALAALRPPRIIYVSCDPATLARDVRTLLAAGYRLERVQPIDVFPQTYHVESVTKLRLT